MKARVFWGASILALAACNGSSGNSAQAILPQSAGTHALPAAAPLVAPRAADSDSADTVPDDAEPAPQATYNGTRGLSYVNYVTSSGVQGIMTDDGVCSGGAHGYGCQSKWILSRSATMRTLNVTSTAPNGSASASSGGSISEGGFYSSTSAVSNGSPLDYLESASARIDAYFVDFIYPPAVDATHPAGTKVSYTMVLNDESDAPVVAPACVDVGSQYDASVSAGTDVQVAIENACSSQMGGTQQKATITTTYGAAVSILGSFSVQTVTGGTTSSVSSAYPKVKFVFHINPVHGSTYTTASGHCYKATGTCP